MASLQPHSLLDTEEEPEEEAIIATGNPGPSGSKGAEGTTGPIKHHSLKRKASGSFDIPSGKGKAFRRLSSTLIEDAVAFLIISAKAVTMTGISSGDLLIDKATKSGKKGKQSIYRCQHCGYMTEQKAQGATHVWSEHLGHCLQCHLCDYGTFRSVDFKPYLTSKHPGRSSEWHELLPDLSSIVAMEVDPKDLIISVKEEPTEESDSSSDSDTDKE